MNSKREYKSDVTYGQGDNPVVQVNPSQKMKSRNENTDEMDQEEPVTEPEETPDLNLKFLTSLQQFQSEAIKEKNNALARLIDETMTKLFTL